MINRNNKKPVWWKNGNVYVSETKMLKENLADLKRDPARYSYAVVYEAIYPNYKSNNKKKLNFDVRKYIEDILQQKESEYVENKAGYTPAFEILHMDATPDGKWRFKQEKKPNGTVSDYFDIYLLKHKFTQMLILVLERKGNICAKILKRTSTDGDRVTLLHNLPIPGFIKDDLVDFFNNKKFTTTNVLDTLKEQFNAFAVNTNDPHGFEINEDLANTFYDKIYNATNHKFKLNSKDEIFDAAVNYTKEQSKPRNLIYIGGFDINEPEDPEDESSPIEKKVVCRITRLESYSTNTRYNIYIVYMRYGLYPFAFNLSYDVNGPKIIGGWVNHAIYKKLRSKNLLDASELPNTPRISDTPTIIPFLNQLQYDENGYERTFDVDGKEITVPNFLFNKICEIISQNDINYDTDAKRMARKRVYDPTKYPLNMEHIDAQYATEREQKRQEKIGNDRKNLASKKSKDAAKGFM